MALRVKNFSEPEPRGLLQPVCRHINFVSGCTGW